MRIVTTWANGVLASLFITCGGIQATHGQAVGNGDAVLHLGETGYASLPDSQIEGFDASGSFSLEVVLNIEPNAAGGRWPVLFGKKGMPWAADPGFALTISQGHFRTFGQQICAVVADGSQAGNLTSRYFQGVVHACMTWNSTDKILMLYVNGQIEGVKTNAGITSLLNEEKLTLGGPSRFGSLGRDVLLARLWNRALGGSEVTATAEYFGSTKRRSLPDGFDTSGLISEWRMDSTVNANSLKDSQAKNHFQLYGSAALWQGNGPLTLVTPAHNATDVSKSVTLRASGGSGNLGSNPLRPLQYEFEIDESDTFDSPALKRSDWLPGYATWKPILKPSTRYYWRTRARDSSAVPVVSPPSSVSAFVTRGPKTWYVRPGVFSQPPIPDTGVYGSQDGTSYVDAWNSIMSIKWGEDGVEPGDTLYLCGRHLYAATSTGFLANQGLAHVAESGFSQEYPITIRMDLEKDPGELWGALQNRINGGGTWTGPDSNGVYSSSDLLYPGRYYASDTEIIPLNKAEATTWEGNRGAFFEANGVFYVKPPDDTHPRGRLCASGGGYNFHLGCSKHILFLNCRLRQMPIQKDWVGTIVSLTAPASHITLDGCDVRYNSQLTLEPGNDHWTVKNSELAFSGNAIYAILNKHKFGANFLTVQNNHIHDIGTPLFYHKDAHAVGVQGGEGHLIEHNRIENTGSAIEFWASYQPMRNHTIRYNFIKNTHVKRVTGGGGIVVSGENTYPVGRRTGFKIYGNIILNTGIGATDDWQGGGIQANCKDFIEIYNNVIYRAGGRAIAVNVLDAPAQARIVNNIIVQPVGRYLQVVGTGSSANLTVDHNLYYPTPLKGQVLFDSTVPGNVSSVYADPMFAAPEPSNPDDFRLLPGSKAIRAGAPVGMAVDYAGRPVSALHPDIGAFQSGASPTATLAPPLDIEFVSPGEAR